MFLVPAVARWKFGADGSMTSVLLYCILSQDQCGKAKAICLQRRTTAICDNYHMCEAKLM